MKKVITILNISLLVLGGCTTKQVAEAPINTVEETTIKETTVKETTTEKAVIETTMVEETTIAEETVSDEIKTLMDKYNGLSREEFFAIDGWKSDNEKLNNNGYCVTLLQETGKTKIMTFDETRKYFEDYFTNNGLTYNQDDFGKSYEIHEEVLGKIKKKQSEAQAEAFSSEVSSHIKSGSGVATVINDLNPYGYTTNNLGYVVQSEQAVAHMKSLKGNDHTLYYKTEIEVFKKNNAGKVTVRSDDNLVYSQTLGTFSSSGRIMWVSRDPSFKTTDALGCTMYPIVDYGYEEFREYCGGTTSAFHGWSESYHDPNMEKDWADNHVGVDKMLGQFIDCHWEWVGDAGERKFRKYPNATIEY